MVAPWLKGLKPNDTAGFNMDAAVEAIADVMETNGAQKADLVGYSLGGLVAIRMASKYPTKVDHLVLISTPVVPSAALLSRQRAVVKITPSFMFKGVGKTKILEALDALSVADIGADLSSVTAPALVISASEDQTGRVNAQSLAKQINAMEYQLPGADPHLLATHPKLLAQYIADFCGGILEPQQTPPQS